MKLGPVDFGTRASWKFAWVMRNAKCGGWCGLFRNSMDVRPGRWGFYMLGFEFGSRQPGNRFGVWLKQIGLWPW